MRYRALSLTPLSAVGERGKRRNKTREIGRKNKHAEKSAGRTRAAMARRIEEERKFPVHGGRAGLTRNETTEIRDEEREEGRKNGRRRSGGGLLIM